jgi:hypothetical protein
MSDNEQPTAAPSTGDEETIVPASLGETRHAFARVRHLFRNGDGWMTGIAEHIDSTGKVSWCIGGAIGRVVTGNPQAMNKSLSHPDRQEYQSYALRAGQLLKDALALLDETSRERLVGDRSLASYDGAEVLIHFNDYQSSYARVGVLVDVLSEMHTWGIPPVERRLAERFTEHLESEPTEDTSGDDEGVAP